MIQESTKTARMGAKVAGTYAELLAKTTGLVGGTSLYALNVNDSVVCGPATFELRERTDVKTGQKFQSPSFCLADGRALSVSAIARRDASGKLHAKSLGLDIILNCQSAAEVVKALEGKTLTVNTVEIIQLPEYGKEGATVPVKQYGFTVS